MTPSDRYRASPAAKKRNARGKAGAFVASEQNYRDKNSPASDRDQQLNFIVVGAKANSARTVFGKYADRVEAENVAKLLKWAGAIVTIERAP